MKIGTRVKKVRSNHDTPSHNLGLTGIVHPGPTDYGRKIPYPGGMFVRTDAPWIATNGAKRPAGSIAHTPIKLWEPIIPEGHRAADEDFELPIGNEEQETQT